MTDPRASRLHFANDPFRACETNRGLDLHADPAPLQTETDGFVALHSNSRVGMNARFLRFVASCSFGLTHRSHDLLNYAPGRATSREWPLQLPELLSDS